MTTQLPRHIVWSTDRLDLHDPFQKRWLLRQILMHGTSQDIRALNLEEIREELDHLDLPNEIASLWRRYLGHSDAGTEQH
jgi:hypothetical protein